MKKKKLFSGLLRACLVAVVCTGGFSAVTVHADVDSDRDAVLSPGESEQALRDLNDRLTESRAVPTFENGQPIGYRKDLDTLKNGDVITGINGKPVQDPAQAFEMMSELKASSQIEVKREGQ